MAKLIAKFIVVLVLTSSLTAQAFLVRLGNLAFPLGSRDNQLFGIGLVSGLANDGDKNPNYTLQSLANTFQSIGISVPAQSISSKNVAVVQVTATIRGGMKSGNKLDVTVAAMGDAKSLQGGVLMQTLLYGIDKKVYATAQGPLAVGGFSLGNSGANVQKNHPTTAQIINGASVEREIPETIVRDNSISYVLREPNFTTAARMAEAINVKYPGSSHAESQTTVRVKIPDTYQTAYVDFIAQLEAVEVDPGIPATIVLNERTGTIVATAAIKISSCAVSHGNIVVKIADTPEASQPSPFAQTGQTVVTTRTDVGVTEDKVRLKALPDMPSIERVAALMNEIGATPRDMMAIFEAMKQAGALQAELVVR
jgi:flagellar P-ring protein FlgI